MSTTTTTTTFVIVGGGLAGAKAAERLRAEGFAGRLLLLGDEGERPYERPPLSKAYLRGETDRDSLYVHQDGFYAAHEIELRTAAPVRSIDPAGRRLELASGERIGYDRLLLATGAAPRRLRLPGAELAGVHYLRRRQDADTLAAAAARAEHVVVVGTGWIGSEAAASLRQLGREVTLLGPDAAPLARVLGPEVAGVYRDLHADHGVQLILGTRVTGFRGHGRVEAVVTDNGDVIEGDLVLVGAGAVPRTELAEAAGLPVRNGVLLNETLEAVGAFGVYAAGDVAAAWHPRYQTYLRVEHWANALHQGPAAARNMLGSAIPYARLPYFYSDQYDLGMEYSGFAATWDQVVVRGDPASHAFIAFWLKDQRVVAGMNANVWDVVESIQTLIRGGRPVDPTRLADPDIPLDQVTGEDAGQRSELLATRSIR
jgi:3-phenylpropionate/trans-cinnamate dioxygenase ferredoxin reductase component